ncbi:MAG: FAD-binding and (Fe-S)-binding domain-containing protein [Bacteroidota bacterium]
MLDGPSLECYRSLKQTFPPGRLISDALGTLAYGTDASFYRLIPRLVIKVESEDEVVAVLREARRCRLPLTFRAAGTSLSGQSISDSLLVVLGNGWKGYTIQDAGERISLQPGVIGAHANVYLAAYRKKIGPDPASINAAMIGGIAANNASGMCCGTSQNSYRTLASMKIILPDGTSLDTGDPASRRAFLSSHPALADGLRNLSQRVKSTPSLAELIRAKYKMKNTTGYSLNALVDFDDPVDILQHLMIGSEGTLGFIAEITYHTVDDLPQKASSLMLFPDIETACRAVMQLKATPVDAVEIMDRASLRSVEGKVGMPEYLPGLPSAVAALLVETRALKTERLQTNIDEICSALSNLPKVRPIAFTSDPSEYKVLWDVRKGLFPSVGAMRQTGTTVIIEDVAFPLPRLAEATVDLQRLLARHGYGDAIIFGHALEGNLHFVFTQDFNTPAEVLRYKAFIEDVTTMVVDTYNGSLKAEHGTGRNMAPFVLKEWGAVAYEQMKELKRLVDPDNLLNPGVILNDDREAHLKNLKPLPVADAIIDKCIECGFCENHCPSKDLTLTPRQRIVIYREIARLQASGDQGKRLHSLRKGFLYAGIETCATDGLCATACPVEIDTGKLVKRLRGKSATRLANKTATLIARHLDGVTSALRALLNLLHAAHRILGSTLFGVLASTARKLTASHLPLWNTQMPRGAGRLPDRIALRSDAHPQVVYLPSCINRTMGASNGEDEESLITVTWRLLRKAGYQVLYPDNLENLCCGMAFDSKGFKDQGLAKAMELEAALLKATDGGRIPVYVDMSPCLFRMKETLSKKLRLYEPVEFILSHLLDRLDFTRLNETIAIHTTCSSIKMGLGEKLRLLAEKCATDVVVPVNVECCGWAGDRGFTVPELNASALAHLRSEIPAGCAGGYSTSRTCEIGLSLHSGIQYKSIVYLVDRCTQPNGGRPTR